MVTELFSQYSSAICRFNGDATAPELLMASEGPLSVYYAPFDWLNLRARVVIVGITPGRTQSANALAEAKRQLDLGASDEQALMRAKRTGAFSGAMRTNLVAMLDQIGVPSWLGIATCDALFGSSSHLLQTASVLQFPVYLNGDNYNGTPDLVVTPLLRQSFLDHFAGMAAALSEAALLPLGPVPTKALQWLVRQGRLDAGRVLDGLPHPSGANGERIQYFLGRKAASSLSSKTDPKKLDAAKSRLQQRVAALR